MDKYLNMDSCLGAVSREDWLLLSKSQNSASVEIAECSSGVIAEEILHAINSHDELVQINRELLAELKAMTKAYVNLLVAGKDHIESLGGDCDEVTYMAAHDVDLVHACSVIGKYDGGAA